MSDEREIVDEFAVPPDADGLAGLVRRMDANPKLELNPTVAPQPKRETSGTRRDGPEGIESQLPRNW